MIAWVWYGLCFAGRQVRHPFQIFQKELTLRRETLAKVSKARIALLALGVSLVVVSSSMTELTDESEPHEVAFSKIAEQSSNFLQAFALIPGSAVVIEGRYIVVLYEHAQKGLYAVAMFTANCDIENCPIGDLIGFSIVDPSQAQQIFYTNLERI